MIDHHLEIGGLYEYIGKNKTAIWMESVSWVNTSELHSLEFGELFVLLAFSTTKEKTDFLVCKGLFVSNGLMGGFVCKRSEIRLKEE